MSRIEVRGGKTGRARAKLPTARKSAREMRASTGSAASAGVAAIVALDTDQLRSLSIFASSLAKARRDADRRAEEYVLDALHELFCPAPAGGDVDLTALAERVRRTPEGRRVVAELEAAERRFFERYQALKSASGLNTYRKLADAAGISVSTVQAIEDQRIKPQFRTIEKLAKAFGVPVTELLGD